MIEEISFEECLLLWNLLWSTRKTPITPISHMKFPCRPSRIKGIFKHEYASVDDISNPTFLGYFVNNNIVGVNSFHNVENTTRSRGLFVIEEYRSRGIGTALLTETLKRANKPFIWSYPKKEAMQTYIKAGFLTASAPIYDILENKINFYVSNKNEF